MAQRITAHFRDSAPLPLAPPSGLAKGPQTLRRLRRSRTIRYLMPMAGDQLDKLREKKAQIDAKLKKLEAREKERARKADTRRKVIAGALALEHAEIDPEFGEKLRSLLARFVNRPQDRALFGLPPKVEEGEGPSPPAPDEETEPEAGS